MTCFLGFLTKHDNHHQRIIFLLIAVFVVVPSGTTIVDSTVAATYPVFAQQQDDDDSDYNREILWVDVKDFISSGTAEDISTAIQSTLPPAGSSSFSAVILALDTPGGSLDATFDIIDAIQQSPVPVIGYVYPQGRSAWSAGTIVLLATDYAAMAPVTTIGSAQPVRGTEPVNDTKVVNAVAEKAVSLAELHERNATQAARFVTQ
jgi:membrane-bound serine protease (ClpP class)